MKATFPMVPRPLTGRSLAYAFTLTAACACIAFSTLSPCHVKAETEVEKILKENQDKETKGYCDRFAEALQKPMPKGGGRYPGAFTRPGQTPGTAPAPAAEGSTNAPTGAESPAPPEKRFEVVAASEDRKNSRPLEEALEKAIGRNLYYDHFDCVQLDRIDKSSGELTASLYALRLSAKSLREAQQFFSAGTGPSASNGYMNNGMSGGRIVVQNGSGTVEHRFIKNVLLILVVTRTSARPRETQSDQPLQIGQTDPRPAPREVPRSRGIEKTKADMDRRLEQLEKGGSSSTSTSTDSPSSESPAAQTGTTSGRTRVPASAMTPEEKERRRAMEEQWRSRMMGHENSMSDTVVISAAFRNLGP